MIQARISFREKEVGRLHVRNGRLHEGGERIWEVVVEIGGELIVIDYAKGMEINQGMPELKGFGTEKGTVFMPLDLPQRSVSVNAELYPEAVAAIEKAAGVEAAR